MTLRSIGRGILRALANSTALGLLAAASLHAAEYRLAYFGPDSGEALQGLQLGIEESNLQGEFLGVRLSLSISPDGGIPDDAVAVFADLPGEIPELSASAAGRAVFNLSDDADALRSACLENVLHVIPSARMKADAVSQWVSRNPGTSPRAAAWHPSAVKFAARDLNRRYLERFGMPMDPLAWAGWFAARAVGDTLMREPGADAGALLGMLKEADGLDGQKGDPHSFRASGQLRQPLVLANEAGELLGEAPVRGADGGLDSLGSSPCK